MMDKHIDLLVEDGDFKVDEAGFAMPVADRHSIAQDVKHRIIESQLLPQLIAQRSEIERETLINKLVIEVEKDTRLEPGTVQIIAYKTGIYYVTAVTIEYGHIKVYL